MYLSDNQNVARRQARQAFDQSMLFPGVSYRFSVDQGAINHGFSRQTTQGVTQLDPAVYKPLLPAKIGVYTYYLLHQSAQLHIYHKIHITLHPKEAHTVIIQLFRTAGTSPLLTSYMKDLEIVSSKPLILVT